MTLFTLSNVGRFTVAVPTSLAAILSHTRQYTELHKAVSQSPAFFVAGSLVVVNSDMLSCKLQVAAGNLQVVTCKYSSSCNMSFKLITL